MTTETIVATPVLAVSGATKLFGAVVAWNLFTLLTFAGAGGAACAWLRSLGLPRGAAVTGGLAFALAPYRVEQSAGHLLGPISLCLPLALHSR